MEKLLEMVRWMDPEKALTQMGQVLKSIFSNVGEEARSRFLLDLMGDSQDKVSSMVHL